MARPPQNATSAPTGQLIALPLWTRVALAAALVLWGGRTDHVVLALPHGTIGLAVLVALVPMLVPCWLAMAWVMVDPGGPSGTGRERRSRPLSCGACPRLHALA
ncbi:MAG: hypothetical protein H0V36_04615 [Chloroflexi bacterium]|nr:hypothetical protein [Chloroflexota bacterium]